ncbi:branched-chain amino acid aminotransferase [Fulvimarina manganoxydans]|uniref:Probable branched-chain-amino-acid aminotransferase n=1 Tax=Fulvimarina manganoxydans TaxID=937218 RepID=A0A1W2AWU5_9HYPH|nr:aminotransferase class IV [Fulvimarina manganoxydans]SMC65163.1 branched-chain amino acid aminotransferase [Fulvimarina manganoxydans]
MTRVWLDDRLVEADDAAIAPTDRGFTLGDGVFDTALVVNSRVFRQEAHLDRLAASCEALSLPIARTRLEAAYAALAQEIGAGSIRLTVTRGTGARGLAFPDDPRPTLFGSASPLATSLFFKPLRLTLAAIRRNETSLTARHKTLSYLDAIIETDRAKRVGADEPLFLNTQGRIACSALANVFRIDGNRLITPPLSDGVLNGIMRGWVLDNAPASGFAVFEESLDRAAAWNAHYILTNSLRLLAPAAIGGEPPPGLADRLAPLRAALLDAIRAECGADLRDQLPGPGE